MDDADRFAQVWRAADGSTDRTFARLLAHYREPTRHYHSLDHIHECLEWFDEVRGLLADPEAVELALWFHDVIYDPRGNDNEGRSADLLLELGRAAAIDEGRLAVAVDMIMATAHRGDPVGSDAEYLVDIDLAILGAEAVRFDRYDRAIRLEYAHVPDVLYRVGRARVLQRFLDRSPLYRTPYFRQRLELRARENLQAALAR